MQTFCEDKMIRIAIITIVSILAGCAGTTTPDAVVARYYSATLPGDLDAFLSCLSESVRQQCIAQLGDESDARAAFAKLSIENRTLAKGARVTKTETHGTSAMVWVSEGEEMPEDGQVFSLSQVDGKWVITDIQMLMTFYKNGSRRDWEKTTEQSSRHVPK
jgi:hypothetical protein